MLTVPRSAVEHAARNRTASANRKTAKGGICLPRSPWVAFRAMAPLLGLFNRIALGDPIGAQIVGKIEDLNIGEPHIL